MEYSIILEYNVMSDEISFYIIQCNVRWISVTINYTSMHHTI